MPIKTPEEAKDFVYNWMTDMGYFGREITPCPEGFNFMLEGMVPTKIPFLIAQLRESANFLLVLATVRVTESSFDSLNAMEKKDRDEFLWNLQKELIALPPNFSFDPTYEETGVPKGMQFSKEIYYDDLTEGELSESVCYTTRCATWVVWSFRRKFGTSEEAKSHAE